MITSARRARAAAPRLVAGAPRQRDAAQAEHGEQREELADARRARERHLVDARVGAEVAARLGAAGDDVDDARRHARLGEVEPEIDALVRAVVALPLGGGVRHALRVTLDLGIVARPRRVLLAVEVDPHV